MTSQVWAYETIIQFWGQKKRKKNCKTEKSSKKNLHATSWEHYLIIPRIPSPDFIFIQYFDMTEHPITCMSLFKPT